MNDVLTYYTRAYPFYCYKYKFNELPMILVYFHEKYI